MNNLLTTARGNFENIKITSCDSKSDAVELATVKLQEIIDERIEKNESVLLLLSGGSNFALLEKLQTERFSNRITIGVLDERYSTDVSVNNFSQLAKTEFYMKAKNAGANFIDTRVMNDENQEMLAERFETALRNWRAENSDGKIIITQGIGIDGHTSGIMSFSDEADRFAKLFNREDKWVMAYDATGKNDFPLRVTTTLSFLKQVDDSVLFVCGGDKANALKRTFIGIENISAVPAKIVFEMRMVWMFTDVKF